MYYSNRMTLRSKINFLVLLNIFFVLVLVLSALSYIFINKKFDDTGNQALFLARTVANIPQVAEAFKEPNPAAVIQPMVENLRVKSTAQFIVVTDTRLIRYSHPIPSNIGKPLDGEDGEIDQKVLKGEEIISTARGSTGLSVRAKTPLYNNNHQQIGLVSVGFLVHDIWNQIYNLLLQIILIGIAALFFGLAGAYLLSGHIKKQIFNLEPHEIAFITKEQAAILDSIREGIIAVNSSGKISTCNREAKKILGIEGTDVTGKDINSILPTSRLMEVLKEKAGHNDVTMLIGDTLVITNRLPVYAGNKVIGAVATFRDKLQLDQIDQRLADIGQYVDSLRSQRHEFMNKLHLISGLIKLKEYEMVNTLIDEVNDEQQNLLDFFLTKIHDSAVVGVLIGKMHQAKELGIQLMVDSESTLPEPCPHREIIVTLLGNAIENSLEAMSGANRTADGIIKVCFRNEADRLLISVEDTGPGIDPRLGDTIFQDGVTTKGSGRGFGLALLSRLITNIGGNLSIECSTSGTTLHASLPK